MGRQICNLKVGQNILIKKVRWTVFKVFPHIVMAYRKNHRGTMMTECFNLGDLVHAGYESKYSRDYI